MSDSISKIIDGKKLAEKIKDKIVKEIAAEKQGDDLLKCPRPNLAIILVGNRKDSELYVSLKEKEAVKVGIDTHLYKCDEAISELELLEMISFLNQDDQVDAILVQLPLPQSIDTDTIILAINPDKDADGFQPDNLEKLYKDQKLIKVVPPVFQTVVEMLESIKFDLKEKKVCIIANSDIFGTSLARFLSSYGGEVEVVNVTSKNLKEKTSKAEVLITAVGKPGFVTKEMVKDEAVVIDVGINNVKGKIVGDVDFNQVSDKVSFITPVPGGVGPMTIALLFKNTLKLFKDRKKHKI